MTLIKKDVPVLEFQRFSGYNILNNEQIEMEIARSILLFYEKDISDYVFSRFCFKHRFASKHFL